MSLNSGRTGQYKHNAQSLRPFGLHGDVNDAHRACADRLQNKNKNKYSHGGGRREGGERGERSTSLVPLYWWCGELPTGHRSPSAPPSPSSFSATASSTNYWFVPSASPPAVSLPGFWPRGVHPRSWTSVSDTSWRSWQSRLRHHISVDRPACWSPSVSQSSHHAHSRVVVQLAGR